MLICWCATEAYRDRILYSPPNTNFSHVSLYLTSSRCHKYTAGDNALSLARLMAMSAYVLRGGFIKSIASTFSLINKFVAN